MKHNAWIALILVAAVPQGLFAAENHLTAQQQLGRRLFEQSCGVCHTRPTLISGMYGPELSRLNLCHGWGYQTCLSLLTLLLGNHAAPSPSSCGRTPLSCHSPWQ